MEPTQTRRTRGRRVFAAALLACLVALPACQHGGDANGGADGGTRAPTTTSP